VQILVADHDLRFVLVLPRLPAVSIPIARIMWSSYTDRRTEYCLQDDIYSLEKERPSCCSAIEVNRCGRSVVAKGLSGMAKTPVNLAGKPDCGMAAACLFLTDSRDEQVPMFARQESGNHRLRDERIGTHGVPHHCTSSTCQLHRVTLAVRVGLQ
jgi:hypothetical protein